VGRPHGLDGSFHVLEPNPQLLALGSMVLVDGEARAIVRRAGTDTRPVLRLEGYTDRAAAQGLTGSELLVARSEAPDLGPDEWWAADLEGCRVSDGAQEVGVVRRLLALPSCEVLEVTRSADASELLVPLVSDAVRSVDVQRRLIDVDLRFLGEEQ
jgi:16S rRNA processing protein RimM